MKIPEANTIRKRFDDDKITRLFEMQWWNWRTERITKNIQLLTSNDLSKIM